MGIPVDRFVSQVDENLICGICHGIFLLPMVTDCGHTFCESCLKRWLQSVVTSTPCVRSSDRRENQLPHLRCPTCRHDLLSAARQQNDTKCEQEMWHVARPVISLKNLIGSLLAHCKNAARGCTVVESIEKMLSGSHSEICAYTPVDCAGCGQTVNRMELPTHQLGCFGIQAELAHGGSSGDENRSVAVYSRNDAETQTDSTESVNLMCGFADEDDLCPNQSQYCRTNLNVRLTQASTLACILDGFMDSELDNSRSIQGDRSMCILSMSLIKLIYALKIELATIKTELRIREMREKLEEGHGHPRKQ